MTPKEPLEDFRPQSENINQHTERGLSALEKSIQEDGWIGAITVAADGEAFDGSARLEVTEAAGITDTVIVRTDGRKRIVVVREDIPTAADDRARRLGIGANRIQQLDYNPDPQMMALAIEEGLVPTIQYGVAEIDELMAQINAMPPPLPEPGNGGDEFDPTPADGPTRAHRGDIWRLGPHTLMCGDACNAEDFKTLMHGRVASLMLADPPYNVGIDYGSTTDDLLDANAYEEFSFKWFPLWRQGALRAIVTPGGQNFHLWDKFFEPFYIAPWIKLNAMTHGRVSAFWVWEPLFYFGQGWNRGRASDVFNHRVTEQRIPDGPSLTKLHPAPKPLSLWIDLVESYTAQGELVIDPMAGTGTTIVAAHRTGRIALCNEISPAYCDVILSRAVAEGIGPVQRIAGKIPLQEDHIAQQALDLT